MLAQIKSVIARPQSGDWRDHVVPTPIEWSPLSDSNRRHPLTRANRATERGLSRRACINSSVTIGLFGRDTSPHCLRHEAAGRTPLLLAHLESQALGHDDC